MQMDLRCRSVMEQVRLTRSLTLYNYIESNFVTFGFGRNAVNLTQSYWKSIQASSRFWKENGVLCLIRKQGLDIYIPLVDDFGIDAVLRKSDGTFIEIQIKARTNEAFGDGALFDAISHELRLNYFFVFYSSQLDKIRILSSEDFAMIDHEFNRFKV